MLIVAVGEDRGGAVNSTVRTELEGEVVDSIRPDFFCFRCNIGID
jgi:hypothetical protein